jgi:glycosyltransferase involved in cell wall biosynthesis
VRILIVADWHAPVGGSELYLQWLRDALRTEGHDTRLVACGPGAGNGGAEFVAFRSTLSAGRAVSQIHNPFAAGALRSALVEFAPEAVLLFGFLDELSPAVLGPLRDVRTVALVLDYKIVCPISRKLLPDGSICMERPGPVCWRSRCVGPVHWLRDQPRYALARSGFGSIDRVVTCSEWMRQVLERHGIDADVLLVPVPPPQPGFRRDPAPAPSFLFLGRLSVEKGVATLLRAFRRVRREIPAATLRIGGDGAEREALVRLSSELDMLDAVTFTGWLEPAAIDAELARAWALVAPSVWAEPMGLVSVEANVRRVPVIASATGGFAETLEADAGGLLVPNGDETALAAAMMAVAAGRAFPDRLVAEAVAARAAARHDLVGHTRKLVRVLEGERTHAA